MAVRLAVVQFPGTNCERETARALAAEFGDRVDILWHADVFPVDRYAAVVLPGGFAYGDHLRAGAIARFSPVMAGIQQFAEQGGLVLGICNGFQVLLEAGLLPGAMLRNASLEFRSEWVYCRVERTDTPFTRACHVGQVLRLPIAHGEGNYVAVDDPRGVVLRYCDRDGNLRPEANPNGSQGAIAGIANDDGNVFALMPHPERAADALLGSTDGRFIFQSLEVALRQELART
ncbi:MAG TPA: phosphoribosylformylglycinamidine synthase I [Hyphomicrobiaceae bacterium]